MIKIRRGAHANIWITFTCGEYKTTNKLPALCMSALIVFVKASFFFFFNHSTSVFRSSYANNRKKYMLLVAEDKEDF